MHPVPCKEMVIITTNVLLPLHKPIQRLHTSTYISYCLPVLLSVLLSEVIERMLCVSVFPGPTHEKKEPQPAKIAAFSIYAYNSWLIAGTIAEDDSKCPEE